MPMAAIPKGLADFQNKLLDPNNTTGTWSNAAFGNGPGGEGSPYSYNVMPLPQAGANNGAGYILKNFSLYEIVQFNGNGIVALPATAPNRGSSDLQVPTALFYQQQVYFAEGPPGVAGQIVHVENGAWLNLLRADSLTGPYPPPPGDTINNSVTTKGQPPTIAIAKQMSVPHGNSILALGADPVSGTGSLSIPDSVSTLPTPVGSGTLPQGFTDPYNTQSPSPPAADTYQNPDVATTLNPNLALQKGVKALNPTSWIHWSVSTGNQGSTMNIPFEGTEANVTAYSADYWLLATDGGTSYDYLAYSQIITMVLFIGGVHYNFPHVTTNIVKRAS